MTKSPVAVRGWWHGADITFRNYRSSNAPTPTTRMVPLTELREHLPAGTAMVTPAERRAAMRHRRNGLRTLYRL
jgi:hypothetical protein